MMSKQAPMQSSSFSIRFKPASVVEHKDEVGFADDVSDTCDISPLYTGSREEVLFERVSNTDELTLPIHCADSQPVTHPSNSWKKSQAALSLSAPVSEAASPTLPSAAEKPTAVKPHASSQLFAEKLSIFTGLKEKLDKEILSKSREIFDRQMKRSGSADAVKVASILADTDVTKVNAVKNEGTDANISSIAIRQNGDQKPDVTEPPTDRDSSVCGQNSSNYIRKSTSSIEVMKADSASMSAAKLKQASLGSECSQEPVVMSRLLSSTSQPDSIQYFAAGSNISLLSESPKNVATETKHPKDSRPSSKSKKIITIARLRHLLSFLVAVLAYIIIPMPAYVSGMLVGAFLSAASISLYQRLTSRPAVVTSSRVRSSASIPADVKEVKNVKGKFQVCKILDSILIIMIVWGCAVA